MSKKLYIAHACVSLMVLAEDEEDAKNVAANYLDEEVDNEPIRRDDITVRRAYDGRHRVYADRWAGDSYPYGDDDDEDDVRTIDEVFRDEERGKLK